MSWKKIEVYVTAALSFGCAFFIIGNSSFADTVEVSKTGQTTCYDSTGNPITCKWTGQDGDMQAGVSWPTHRFADNGDGTITDNLTGLMWLKDANCFGRVTWGEALIKVKDLNLNPENYTCGDYTATYSDWALPNINEMESLSNAEVSSLAVWLGESDFLNIQLCSYWSSTTMAYSADVAWGFDLQGGELSQLPKIKSNKFPLWPVRAETTQPAAVWKTGQTKAYAAGDDGHMERGVEWPSPRFINHGDGTVTDNLTGLMWLKDANCFGDEMTWQEALSKLSDFNANPQNYSCSGYDARYKDWRLPNRKELHSLTDFSKDFAALPSPYPFSGVQWNRAYWSSTTCVASPDLTWIVSMGIGSIGEFSKFGIGCTWPVRAGLIEKEVSYVESDGLCAGKLPCYTSIHEAISTSGSEAIINIAEGPYDENLILDQAKHLTLRGGWNSSFTTRSSYATVTSMTINNGTVVPDRIILK